ncbi:hypothetical protein [Rhizobium binae]|uniref:HNH endonuclease n=1 Tax=Rhizobium binae TaxID=1138190 RepID=A0ABV2MPC8_9HYPH|nr:hypothetical protein [Rhizobium binae]NKL51924.1 hypothetical protein [Rhizobium leguminosarum bv. viciae]MBX4938031.1 hypothetical protein [Rhizobium binae]MBX4944395.1 hypothetical protein [Rhizobium binae]MBX4980493.1 hypothetical protein [Rhizobium binae]MBX4995665.1 hypothetical protein [Rhizobium binae]
MEFSLPSVKFVCSGCGATIHTILEEVPPYDLMADRESDAQGFVEQAVECTECDRQFRVGIRNTGAGLAAVLEDENTPVEVINDPIASPDDEWGTEAYQRENLPNDPGQIFKFATYDIDFVASEVESGGHGSIAALNRMLLVQYFSAIEAYLSDRLIRLVLDDPKSMSALVRGNKEWAAEKISVVELASNPDAFRDWVHTRLRELMYHNFVKIDQYYRSALGSTIFPDEATKKILMEFVPVRHDCVHRYGRDHDGRERTISKADLDKLGSALENMVAHLEGLFVRRGTNG